MSTLSTISSIAQKTKNYAVNAIQTDQLIINGLGDNPLWQKAEILADFIYPWNEGSPPAMSFQGLHDQDYLYGLYKVIDPKKILIFQNTNHKKEVLASDRVEIFFRKNDKMDPYYGLEMDPLTRIYDYRARYQRKFRQEWSWPEGEVTVKATINDTGYILEFAISKKSLRTFDLIKNNKIEAGLYRGECVQLEGDKAEFKWISWVKPDSETPNFHIASSFGVLELK